MSKKQTTLLQTWGYEGNIPSGQNVSSQNVRNADVSQFQNDENDDAFLIQAMEEQENNLEIIGHGVNDPKDFEDLPTVPQTPPSEVLPGFDVEAGRTWIYPTNYPVRDYQYNISRTCLYDNTLVSLPTGLGKTFIAAVLMYNYFRWYPQGKVVFMAPTKPLVAQQIEACYKIMGIPQSETSEMTGNVSVSNREKAWTQKRVFFLTPQVMSNDLSRGLFPADQVRLLVVDEAHRAQGEYAYCQVVRELVRSGGIFRVCALSATPGSDLQAVRMMLQNLEISKIELRDESSPDIVPYTFERKLEKIVIPHGAELLDMKRKYLSIMEVFIKRLASHSVLSRRSNSTNPEHYTKFALIQSWDEHKQNPSARFDNYQRGLVSRDFTSAITLYHGLELLMKHGLRSFYNFMLKKLGESASPSNNTTSLALGASPGTAQAGGFSPSPGTFRRSLDTGKDHDVNRNLKYELKNMPIWMEMLADLREKFSEDSNHSRLNVSRHQLLTQFGATQNTPKEEFPLGHPKLEKLRGIVIEHFKTNTHVSTRVMIFSQYRDSVQEITAMLHAHKPLIKVMEFVGQSGTKGKKGLTQKEQLEVVRRFKDGGYNTLVATCVGEEGLDIGEVDLIICYDVSKSPISLTQRMGRTGRKRAGRIVVLVTEGKEDQDYQRSTYAKNSINKAILDQRKLASFFSYRVHRMVPKGINPVCHKMVMQVGTYVGSKSNAKSSVGPSNNKKIYNLLKKVDKGETYRQSCGYLLDSEVQEYLEMFPNPEELFKNVPTIRPRRELWTLQKENITHHLVKELEHKTNHFELDSYNLWQDEGQKRFHVSMSSKSQFLCNIMGLGCINDNNQVNDNSVGSEHNNIYDNNENMEAPDAIKVVNDENLEDWAFSDSDEDIKIVFDDRPKEEHNTIKISKESVVCKDQNDNYNHIFEDDPYHQMYSYKYPEPPTADYISSLIKKIPPSHHLSGFNLKEALICYRKIMDRSRSPSPVFLSQNHYLKNNRHGSSSTPTADAKKTRKVIPCNEEILLTPVEKPATSSRIKKDAWKGGDDESAFDDSFVKFSSREESQLFDPTQLNSILNRSSSGKITSKKSFDAVGAESSHFDSLVKNLSDWPISMEHQDDSHEQKDIQITARDFSDGSLKNVRAFNFELISEGFWEILENIPSPEEFKVPNIGDYDIKKQTTTPKQANKKSSTVAPDSPIFYSQSPLLVQKRSRRAIFSSTDEDSIEEEKPKIKTNKLSTKKKFKKNNFIDDEAELSGLASSDEEMDNQSEFESSFVDDGTQQVSKDQTAIYLQSIKSPPKRKMITNSKPTMAFEDIYSQPVTDTMLYDDYDMSDSFVVSNDKIEYESSADELDFIPEFKDEVKKPQSNTISSKPKRKRIVISSSEDENEEIKKPPEKFIKPVLPEKIPPPPSSSISTAPIMTNTENTSTSTTSSKKSGVSILVNANEVHRCQEAISCLRHDHGMEVHVQAKFDGAGYLLSTRLAVTIIRNSQFIHGGSRHKLVQTVQTMNQLFERPYLIIELDKLDQSKFFLEMGNNRTKYVDMTMAQFCPVNCRVLYSVDPAESGQIMATLANKEAKKGYGLPVSMKLPKLSELYLPFYTAIPGVNYALALLMALEFKSPKDVGTTAVATLVRKLKIEEKRAQKIHNFFRTKISK